MLMNSAPGSPWTQVGVVSWGIGIQMNYLLHYVVLYIIIFLFLECSKPPYPGVYTSVAHFIEWINKNAT